MRFEHNILVLISICFLHETDASDSLKKISDGRESPSKDEYIMDPPDTHRFHMPSFSAPASSHQQSPTDSVNEFKTGSEGSPQIAPFPGMIQNNEIQYQSPEHRPEYPQENTRWLIEQYRRGTLPLIPSNFNAFNQHLVDQNTSEPPHVPLVRKKRNKPMKGDTNELVHMPSMRIRGGTEAEEAKRIRDELAQFRTMRPPPRERIQQRPDHKSGMNDS